MTADSRRRDSLALRTTSRLSVISTAVAVGRWKQQADADPTRATSSMARTPMRYTFLPSITLRKLAGETRKNWIPPASGPKLL